MLYSELYEKLQKFVSLLIEDMDAEQLGAFMVAANLRGWELAMFLRHVLQLDSGSREAYERYSAETEKQYDNGEYDISKKESLNKLLDWAKHKGGGHGKVKQGLG